MIDELRVLEPMIGIWDEEVEYKPAAWTPNGEKAASVTTKRMNLAERYIFYSGVWQPKNTECTCLPGLQLVLSD